MAVKKTIAVVKVVCGMKIDFRFSVVVLLALFVVAGCQSLPGLRVLSGEDSADVNADRIAETTTLVMGDKSGLTDPSLMEAANRIERATDDNLDIVEIRRDLNNDVFDVAMLYTPPAQDATGQEIYDLFRRYTELTWQGIMNDSAGSDVLSLQFLAPGRFTSLDKGPSIFGVITIRSQITRQDAMLYLSAPHTLNDFVDMIAQGRMTFDLLTNTELYEGEPNHPVFMLGNLGS